MAASVAVIVFGYVGATRSIWPWLVWRMLHCTSYKRCMTVRDEECCLSRLSKISLDVGGLFDAREAVQRGIVWLQKLRSLWQSKLGLESLHQNVPQWNRKRKAYDIIPSTFNKPRQPKNQTCKTYFWCHFCGTVKDSPAQTCWEKMLWRSVGKAFFLEKC